MKPIDILALTDAEFARYMHGCRIEIDWRGGHYGTKEGPKLESPDGRTLTLKEAEREMAAQVRQPVGHEPASNASHDAA